MGQKLSEEEVKGGSQRRKSEAGEGGGVSANANLGGEVAGRKSKPASAVRYGSSRIQHRIHDRSIASDVLLEEWSIWLEAGGSCKSTHGEYGYCSQYCKWQLYDTTQ